MKSWGWAEALWTRYAERLERKVSRCMVGEVRVLLWKHSFGEGVGTMGESQTMAYSIYSLFPIAILFPQRHSSSKLKG